jgi:hypothetical protein
MWVPIVSVSSHLSFFFLRHFPSTNAVFLSSNLPPFLT